MAENIVTQIDNNEYEYLQGGKRDIQPNKFLSKTEEISFYLNEAFRSRAVTAGLMGNIESEISTFDEFAKQKNGGGRGLFQFDSKYKNYQDFLEFFEREDSIESQIYFVKNAIETNDFIDIGWRDRDNLKKAFSSNDPKAIAKAFMLAFEKPFDQSEKKQSERAKSAEKWFNLLTPKEKNETKTKDEQNEFTMSIDDDYEYITPEMEATNPEVRERGFLGRIADIFAKSNLVMLGVPYKLKDESDSMAMTIHERIFRGIMTGLAGTAESAGSAFQAYGNLEQKALGTIIQIAAQRSREKIQVPEPKFFDKVAAGFGSMTAFYLPGYGVARGAQALSFAPKIAAIFGASASGILESLIEAGSTYASALEKGFPEREAHHAANTTFLLNLPATVITNRLGLFSDYGPAPVRSLLSGSVEGLQEFLQQVIGNISLKEEDVFQGSGEAFTIGLITGAGTKATIDTIETMNQLKDAVNKETDSRELDNKDVAVQKTKEDFEPKVKDVLPKLANSENVSYKIISEAKGKDFRVVIAEMPKEKEDGVRKGVKLVYMGNDPVPVETGYWIDKPEKSFPKEYNDLPMEARANLEANWQLKKFAEFDFKDRWLEKNFPELHNKIGVENRWNRSSDKYKDAVRKAFSEKYNRPNNNKAEAEFEMIEQEINRIKFTEPEQVVKMSDQEVIDAFETNFPEEQLEAFSIEEMRAALISEIQIGEDDSSTKLYHGSPSFEGKIRLNSDGDFITDQPFLSLTDNRAIAEVYTYPKDVPTEGLETDPSKVKEFIADKLNILDASDIIIRPNEFGGSDIDFSRTMFSPTEQDLVEGLLSGLDIQENGKLVRQLLDMGYDGIKFPATALLQQYEDPELYEIYSKGNEIRIFNQDALKKLALIEDEKNQSEEFASLADQNVVESIKKGRISGKQVEASDLEEAYERQKDIWLGNKDVKIMIEIPVQKKKLQDKIKQALGIKRYNQLAKDMDTAIQVYIDSKRNPHQVEELYSQLTEEKRKIVDLSKNLPEGIKKIADEISDIYQSTGLEALENDVIRNVLDNYTARVWDLDSKKATEKFRKFGIKTRHSKKRVLDTIVEGWSKGFELKVKGSTNNLAILQDEIYRTIEDKKFIKALQKVRDIDGNKLLTIQQLPGYTKVEHPNFKVWKWAGTAEEGETYGLNFFLDDKGNLYEKKSLYAPKEVAKNLNNIMGVSKLKGVKLGPIDIDAITKFNALTKAWILQTSLFHHLAFIRSFYLGTNRKTIKEMNIVESVNEGNQIIEEMHPVIIHGVRNGLTLGVKQDWEEHLLKDKTAIEKVLDKYKSTKNVKDKILEMREDQANFLFNTIGAGLKAKAYMIEYRNQIRNNPNEDVDVIAKRVANLINDDFGGLNLARIGRNPTAQHIFRLLCLAPDWTESNIRTMVKAFKKGKEGEMYRNFWAGVIAKGVTATVLANMAMASFDEDDKDGKGLLGRFVRNYRTSFAEGKFRWLDVDITPIYKAFGGTLEDRFYFSILGHFKDPFKFTIRNDKAKKDQMNSTFALGNSQAMKHKASIVGRLFTDYLTGTDYAERRFTTLKELAGVDTEKGYYKTSRKGRYKKGDQKFGKLKGKTVTYDMGKGGMVELEQIPSFLINQSLSMQPVQVQQIIRYFAGELDGFIALTNALGLGVSRTYGREKRGEK